MQLIQRVDHLNVQVPPEKEAEAKKFYGEVMGLKPLKKPDSLGPAGQHYCISENPWYELHLGVGFQSDRGSTYLKSNADGSAGRLVQWVSLFGLSTDDVPRVIDAHAFEGGDKTIPEGAPVPIGIDAALATVAEE